MIEEDYVSYEIAKLLKEKGFDEYCYGYYYTSEYMTYGDIKQRNLELFRDSYSAPTIQRTMKWLREVHSILVMIDYNYECTSKSYCYKIYCLGKNGKPKRFPVYGVAYDDEGNANRDIIYYRDFLLSDSEYATYEQAVDGALYYCLEYLI